MTEIEGIIERLKAARGDDGGSAIYADQDAIDDAIAFISRLQPSGDEVTGCADDQIFANINVEALRRVAESLASPPSQPPADLAEQVLRRFIISLTNGSLNRETMLSINHDEIRALLKEAEIAIQSRPSYADGYAKAIEDAENVARCFADHAAMTIKDKGESAASVAVAAVRGNVAAAVHIAAAIRALAGKDAGNSPLSD